MSNAIHNGTTSAITQNQHAKDKHTHNHPNVKDLFSKMLEQFRALGVVNIDGRDGDDIINATGFQVNIKGRAGNDVINASGIQTNLYGGAGNDVINASGDQTNLRGGAGNDTLNANAGQANVKGGDGDDAINASGTQTNLYGGAGNDVINASGIQTNLCGDEGNDTLNANAGQANVKGGDGDDVINAHADQVNVSGDAGNDEINAFGMQINVKGGDGDDVINAFGMQANIYAGAGNDTLNLVSASIGNIKYFSGDGHDRIVGAGGASSITVGSGLSLKEATFSSKGENITIHFADGNGSITIQDYKELGVPGLQFSDGESLSASEFVMLAGGDPKDFKKEGAHFPNTEKEIVDLP